LLREFSFCLEAGVAGLAQEARVFGGVAEHGFEAVQDGAASWERLAAEKAEAFLLLVLFLFEFAAMHWLTALVVDQVFCDFAAQGPKEFWSSPQSVWSLCRTSASRGLAR
jgi:hypothetical protein